jgi:hypothetical protein
MRFAASSHSRPRGDPNRSITFGASAMTAIPTARCLTAPAILIGILAAGCGADDSGASPASEPDADASSDSSPAPSPSEEATIDEAYVEAITTCERLLLTPDQVSQVLGVQIQAPRPLEAGGVVLGCEYATPNKDQGGGQLVIDASTASSPPAPFSTAATSIKGVGDEAAFNPQPGATTILRVRSGEAILDFDVGGVLLYEQFGNQEAMAAPLVELANQALSALAEDVSG